MKTLILLPHSPKASELWLDRMISAMAGDVAAIAAFHPRQDQLQPPSIDLGFKRGAMGRSFGFAQLFPGLGASTLIASLGTLRPQVVLCHYATLAAHFHKVIERSPVPWVVHCHGYDITWTTPIRSATSRGRGRRYRERLRALADHVVYIANSEFSRTRMIEEADVPPERIEVKYLGVPPEVPGPRTHTRTRRVRILYLGRLVDFKGPLETIMAFELARDNGADAELIMAGDGPLLKTCLRRARTSRHGDRIAILGAVAPDVGVELRSRADVFTAHHQVGRSSGQQEAFGVSVVEAMNASLPVVAGNSGALSETVVHGRTGILFTPGDVEGHASELLRLVQDPERRTYLGSNGLQRATNLFSLEREAALLRSILTSAADS